MKHILAMLLILFLAGAASAAAPNFTVHTPADDITDQTDDSRTFYVLNNQSGIVKWYINGSLMETETKTSTGAAYINLTPARGHWNVTAHFSNSQGTARHKWNWSVNDSLTIAAYGSRNDSSNVTTSATVTDEYAVFNRSFNISSVQLGTFTWKFGGVVVKSDESLNQSTYSNTTPKPGTWTVSVNISNVNGTTATRTWTWIVTSYALTNLTVTTNLSSSDRIATNANGTFNFSWENTGNVSTVNITFPGGAFKFGGLNAGNIINNIGTCTFTTLTSEVQCFNSTNATGMRSTYFYIYLPGNLAPPTTAGDYSINIRTNKNSTGRNLTLYVRNTSQPYYVKSNNSVFTVSDESFAHNSLTMNLVGKGYANLTIYAPNATNQTVAWGASNASVVRVRYSGTPGLNYIYIEPDPDVTNPVIVVYPYPEIQSSNVPAAIIAAGAVATFIYFYRIRKKTR